MKLPASFIIRDIELNDRARWEPLWRAYSRAIPEEVTEMTWRRFFDGLEPVHALVAEEGEAMIGFVHYPFTVRLHSSAPSVICKTCSRLRLRADGVSVGP